MKYYLSKSSLFKKRDWVFLSMVDLALPEVGNHYQILQKSIYEICKLAVYYMHQKAFDLMVCRVNDSRRIYIDGYIDDKGYSHVSISLSIGKRSKFAREYLIGIYGDDFEDKFELGDQYEYGWRKSKKLGSKYPL